MTAQALSQLPDLPHRFDVERQARLMIIRSRSQNLPSGSSGRYSFGGKTRTGSMVGWSTSQLAVRWLKDAFAQVDRINREAEEEGYPRIGELAKKNAKHVLSMAGRSSVEPVVYPSMDGEIAIYFKSPVAAAALLILLNNDGGAGSYWSVGGKSQRRRHEDAAKLPPDFLSTQLRALGGLPLSQSVD